LRGSALSISFATAEASPIAQMSKASRSSACGTGADGREIIALSPQAEELRAVSASRNYSPQAFHPGEIDLLGRVFEQLLEERQVPNCGDQAEALAARLISIYQSGERRIEILKKLTLHS
jgi:hypothetical protein